jgi:hypothetical protein
LHPKYQGMTVKEKVEKLFGEIKKGHYEFRDEFFETIWVNVTSLAHGDGGTEWLREWLDWASAHSAEHPDFLELTLLSIGAIEFLADDFDLALHHLERAHDLFSARKDEDGVAACYIYRSGRGRYWYRMNPQTIEIEWLPLLIYHHSRKPQTYKIR